MTEAELVERSDSPATISSLTKDLSRLGVAASMTLLVHSSLSSIGWTAGGAAAVVLALENVLGPEGTLVMPTHSTDLSDPAQWQKPPVPQSWWDPIRTETPAYDANLTPTRGMGAIPECFRNQKDVRRSAHPHMSFAARGPRSDAITGDHRIDYGLGEQSPVARIYESDGHVLLLGVGHERNTSLHLAEYRAEFKGKRTTKNGAPVLVEGERRWVEFEDVDLDEGDFARIGHDFEAETDAVAIGKVAAADARLMSQRVLVDYAVEWMGKNR